MPRVTCQRPLPRLRLLSCALILGLLDAGGAAHAQSLAAPACTPGTLGCRTPRYNYSQCRRNDLLDFFTPGLPRLSRAQSAHLPVQVHAAHAHSTDGEHFALRGQVRLQRGDQLLQAPSIDYTRGSTAYRASGSGARQVTYQDQSLLLAAHSISGTTTPQRAEAQDVRYQLLAARGNGAARSAQVLDAERSRYQDATFSTCDPGSRLWYLQGRQFDINHGTGIGIAHDVSMRFMGVPFLWLPWMRFPVNGQRLSGFLAPSFGGSSNSGTYLRVPYYLNLAPNYDATLEPAYYSKRGAMLGGQFRYLFGIGTGELNFNYMPHDQLYGARRWSLQYQDYTYLAPGWSFNANINRVSDNTYFEDFGNSLTQAATSLLGSSAYINGGGNWWNASLGVDTYQLTDPTLPQSVQPYSRLPRGTLNLDIPLSGPFIFGLRSEAVAFRKSNALEGSRLDLYPYLEAPLQGAAWFLRPRIGYRYTQYWLQGNNGTPDRALPIASIDSGLYFDRSVNLFGHSYTQTLEPRAYYLYVPYRNQNNLPIFDTAPLTFDWWSLFSSNQYTGADRQVNANNLTLALSTRLIDSSGIERFSAGIGQIRYFTPQRVQLPGYPITYESGSAYVGMLSLGLSRNWSLQWTQQYDPSQHRTTVSTIAIQRRLDDDGVLNLAYRYRNGLLDQYDVSTLWPVDGSWSLVGRWDYSVRDHRTLEAFGGVEWDSCCVSVRGVVRRYVRDYQGNMANAIMLEVVFKGIGGLGSRTGSFLSHAILGYQ